jgi:hypothetical protein
MLFFSELLVGIIICLFVFFLFYLRFRGRVHAAYQKERETLLHTEVSLSKRQQEFGLQFADNTKPFAKELAEKLESHFSLSYQVHVYNRMVKETSFSERKLMQLLFEQKRFLLMASVLRNVPMFSKEVERVWHEMLMFTKDYTQFTESFAGQYLHHVPYLVASDSRDTKFTFDMMYLVFFDVMPFSEELWGSRFYSVPPSSDLLLELEHQDPSTMERRFFFDNSHAKLVSATVVNELKQAMAHSKKDSLQPIFKVSRDALVLKMKKPKGKPRETLKLAYILWASTDGSFPYSASIVQTVAKRPHLGTHQSSSTGSV